MTEKEINRKAQETYPKRYSYDGFTKHDLNYQKREGYTKAIQEIEEQPKIKGWIYREKNDELYISAQGRKPFRKTDYDFTMSDGWIVELDEDLFPELTWESEPVEIELLIRKI